MLCNAKLKLKIKLSYLSVNVDYDSRLSSFDWSPTYGTIKDRPLRLRQWRHVMIIYLGHPNMAAGEKTPCRKGR